MDRRVKKTKAAIQAAYFELLTEKKTMRVTITDIARRADIDRKTFYLHYDSVEDIVREFCEDQIQKLIFALEKEDFFKNPIDVSNLFHTLNRFIEDDIELYRHLATDETYNFFWENLAQVLIRTMHDVYFEQIPLSAEQFDIHARFISSGFLTIYRSWLRKEIPMNLDELGKTTGEVTYYGLQKFFPGANIPN